MYQEAQVINYFFNTLPKEKNVRAGDLPVLTLGHPWLPIPAICENWTSAFIFFAKPRKDNSLEKAPEPVFHPIHLAVEFKKLVDQKLVNNYADIAKRYGMSRARVTQIMNLLALPVEVQTYLLGLEDKKSIRRLSERRLRKLTQSQSTQRRADVFWRLAGQPSVACKSEDRQ